MIIANNIPSNDPVSNQFSSELSEIEDKSAINLMIKMTISLTVLLFGAWVLLYGAVGIAKNFGMSDLVIGLTIVAVGTSLPETATSIMSLIKKKYDIALGNIIGSNMFNMLAVLTIPVLITPIDLLDPDVITVSYTHLTLPTICSV